MLWWDVCVVTLQSVVMCLMCRCADKVVQVEEFSYFQFAIMPSPNDAVARNKLFVRSLAQHTTNLAIKEAARVDFGIFKTIQANSEAHDSLDEIACSFCFVGQQTKGETNAGCV